MQYYLCAPVLVNKLILSVTTLQSKHNQQQQQTNRKKKRIHTNTTGGRERKRATEICLTNSHKNNLQLTSIDGLESMNSVLFTLFTRMVQNNNITFKTPNINNMYQMYT